MTLWPWFNKPQNNHLEVTKNKVNMTFMILINPLNTGGTSNVCLLTKFCGLATICGVIIYKVSKQLNFGKLLFQWGLFL